jgi:predicted Rossmann fold flavoprotein
LEKFDVVVIGAGASGLLAAGRAASLGVKVLLLDKMEREGRKLLITGKGRCNITNQSTLSEFVKHVHPSGNFLKPALNGFYHEDIMQLLEKYKVETVVERGARVFPKSNKAADVVNALVKWAVEQGVTIRLKSKVQHIQIEGGQVTGVTYLNNDQQIQLACHAIILSTGGYSYPATGSNGEGHVMAQKLGHAMEKSRQALVPIEVSEKIEDALNGLNLRNVRAIVWSDGKKLSEDFGELTFAPWGLTGPIVLTLSRGIVDAFKLGKKLEISIDLKPALTEQTLDARLLRDIDVNGKMPLDKLFKLWLPMQLINPVLARLSFDAKVLANQLTAKDRRQIRILLKDFRFHVSGIRPFKEAIITAGGVKTSDINSKTMESKIVKSLYFAGEMIDVDADTGGYNLQIAFSTGWLAGTSSAKAMSV